MEAASKSRGWPYRSPAGDTLGLADTGAAVRQVAEAMRNGANPTDHQFGPIVLVGHSAASIAATYLHLNHSDSWRGIEEWLAQHVAKK